jgi:hypothetical protein
MMRGAAGWLRKEAFSVRVWRAGRRVDIEAALQSEATRIQREDCGAGLVGVHKEQH